MSRRRKNRGEDAQDPILVLLTVEFHFPEAQSLKQKRMALKAVKDRLNSRFNVAVAETGYQELWQRGILSVASVGSTKGVLESAMQAIERDLEERFPSELVACSYELIEGPSL